MSKTKAEARKENSQMSLINKGTVFETNKFCDIFPEFESFDTEYRNSKLFSVLDADHFEKLYYLLYGRYGGSTISAYDENQFKYGLASIVYSYGGTWCAKDKIQKKLRDLVDDEAALTEGTTAINNTASNPGTLPTDQTTEEIKYLDSQAVNKVKYGRMSAYQTLYNSLVNDVTEKFINRFAILFKTNLADYEAPLYGTVITNE